MSGIKVIFGSTTGDTESAANEIASKLGGGTLNVAEASAADFSDADLLVLGTSTWGLGELQDDWLGKIDVLSAAALRGKKVALFGLGDQSGFADTFVDGMGALADAVENAGATIIGRIPTNGYSYMRSTAERDGKLVGLALDMVNESDKNSERIDAWVGQLKKEMA